MEQDRARITGCPAPNVGEGSSSVDRALDLRQHTGNATAYREALLAAVRENPR